MSGKAIELTLEKIENSKVYVHQTDLYKFKSPMDYLSPFIDELEPLGVTWTFQGEKGSVNKNSEDDEVTNIAYSRLTAKAKLPSEFDVNVNDPLLSHITAEIGFVYALDTQKPEMRVFRGNRVSLCTNQCIFGSHNILNILLTDPKTSVSNIYDKTKQYIENAMKERNRLLEITEILSNEVYGERMINEKFGEMLRLGITNNRLGVNVVTGAIQSMLSKTSRYAISDNKTITGWAMYNSLTEEVKKSSILDEASRALLLEPLFVKSLN